MKGHIKERSPGHWAIVIDLHDDAGKRRRKWHSFKGTKRQAQDECARLITAIRGGTYHEPAKTKVREYLAQWLDHTASNVGPRTHERYAEIVRTYLVPSLGQAALTKLQPITISAAYAKIRTMRTKGHGQLSDRTVLHCHRVLSAALRQAVRWRIIPYNAASDVKAPRVERRKPKTHSLTEMADMIEALRGHWMFIPALLGFACGLRRGEIAALRWGAVDLDAGQLAVVQSAEQTKAGVRYKEPKTGQMRTLALSPTVVAELRSHRIRTAEAMLRLRVKVEADSFVIAQADGSPYDPDSISKEWRLQMIRSGLPRIRFHDTRHTHATNMLRAKVHPKVASERMGHSRVGVTLDIYSHVVAGMQDEAVALVDAAMAQALQKRAAESDR
jgi:integrase